LWFYGVYQKEPSISALLLVLWPLACRRTLVEHWSALQRSHKVVVAAVVVAAAAPLLHMLVAVAQISRSGDLIYGAQLSTAQGLRLAGEAPLRLISKTGSVAWPMMAVLTLILLAVRVRRRQPIALEVVLVLVAGALLAMNVQTGFFESRYYLPSLGLLAVVFSLLTADLGPRSAVAAVWVVVLCAGFFLPTTFSWVRQWADLERAGGKLVLAVSAADATGCPVRITGLDPERTQSLPVLVRLKERPLKRSCGNGGAYLVEGSDAPADQRLLRACTHTWNTVGSWALTAGEIVRLRACR
jgi:hypothetical protein